MATNQEEHTFRFDESGRVVDDDENGLYFVKLIFESPPLRLEEMRCPFPPPPPAPVQIELNVRVDDQGRLSVIPHIRIEGRRPGGGTIPPPE